MKTPVHNKSTTKAERALTRAEKALVTKLVADGLSIQDKFRPESLYKQTSKGHYEGGAVAEIRKAKEKSRGRPA